MPSQPISFDFAWDNLKKPEKPKVEDIYKTEAQV